MSNSSCNTSHHQNFMLYSTYQCEVVVVYHMCVIAVCRISYSYTTIQWPFICEVLNL